MPLIDCPRHHHKLHWWHWLQCLASVWFAVAAPQLCGSSAANDSWVYHGVARPRDYVELSLPLDGVLQDVHVREGDWVETGQLLAELDHQVATASLNVARAAADRTADIEFARHEVALAESLLKRVAAVRADRAAAEFEYEEALAKRDQAQAALASELERIFEARQQLALAEARRDLHRLRAPFAGQVVRVAASRGAALTPRDALITLADARMLKAELHVPLAWFGKLRPHGRYRLQAGEPVAATLEAELDFVSPLVDAGSRTFRCVFLIDNREGTLPAGFAVKLELPESPPVPTLSQALSGPPYSTTPSSPP